MRTPVRLSYRAKPSVIGFMTNIARPAPRAPRDGPLPDMQAHWRGQRISPRDLAGFFELSGLPASETLPILYPHTISFPMLMAVLSHPRFPVPIWNVLQVRNRLMQHAPIAPDAALDFSVRTGERRVLEKGLEMDLLVSAEAGGRVVWEAVDTFYARGRFGAAQAAVCPSPNVAGTTVAEWRLPAHGRWRYGRLSGDLNPLHMSDGYARRFGYSGAFTHPQRIIGQCLGHLGAIGALGHVPMQLETWIKGPVFYGARLSLRAEARAAEQLFALHVDDDARPAIVGRFVTPNIDRETST